MCMMASTHALLKLNTTPLVDDGARVTKEGFGHIRDLQQKPLICCRV